MPGSALCVWPTRPVARLDDATPVEPSKDILRARFSSTKRHFETRRRDAPVQSSRQSQRGRPWAFHAAPQLVNIRPTVLVQGDSDFLELVPKNKRKELAAGNVNFPRHHKIPLLSIHRAVRRLHLGTNPKSWGARNATIRHGRLYPARRYEQDIKKLEAPPACISAD